MVSASKFCSHIAQWSIYAQWKIVVTMRYPQCKRFLEKSMVPPQTKRGRVGRKYTGRVSDAASFHSSLRKVPWRTWGFR
ncbi:hypothetical protein PoB_006696700 [Plakobranchus ocellatus]|uniref:Uncharacterized protein n=1 Tax=Plakobranchus ocellatus TaxID=259542 RepID=A0AAV4D8P5_9GAST|nr:hypothetical protein PoB_006696700 [Plakobranchus ocellatus]